MARLISIIPCDAYYVLEFPQRLVGPGYVYGDEFGVPEGIDVAVSLTETGQGDEVHLELRDLTGHLVARTESALFDVPDHIVPQLLGFELELGALAAYGRYNLVCLVEGTEVGGCDVVFREVQTQDAQDPGHA
jgi:hypothetical protein